MIDSNEKAAYTPEGRKLFCTAGRPLFEQGAPSNQVFFIDEGRVEVSLKEGPHTVHLGELGAGEIFGEMGILEDQSRMASVVALEDTTVTVLSRKELEDRIEALSDGFIKALIRSLSNRIRQSTRNQVRYYKELATFQDRISGLVHKADEGIDQSKRDSFAREAVPLLDQLDALLDKYRQ